MSVAFDPSSDFAQAVDGLQTVTLHRKQLGEAVEIVAALRREVVSKEAEPSGGAAWQTDAVWLLQLP